MKPRLGPRRRVWRASRRSSRACGLNFYLGANPAARRRVSSWCAGGMRNRVIVVPIGHYRAPIGDHGEVAKAAGGRRCGGAAARRGNNALVIRRGHTTWETRAQKHIYIARARPEAAGGRERSFAALFWQNTAAAPSPIPAAALAARHRTRRYVRTYRPSNLSAGQLQRGVCSVEGGFTSSVLSLSSHGAASGLAAATQRSPALFYSSPGERASQPARPLSREGWGRRCG